MKNKDITNKDEEFVKQDENITTLKEKIKE